MGVPKLISLACRAVLQSIKLYHFILIWLGEAKKCMGIVSVSSNVVLKNDSAVVCLHYNKSIRHFSMHKKLLSWLISTSLCFHCASYFVAYLCSQSVHMLGLSHVCHVTPVDVSISVHQMK